MDSFTEQLVQRAKARREQLDSAMAHVGLSGSKRCKMPLLEKNERNASASEGNRTQRSEQEVMKMASPPKSHEENQEPAKENLSAYPSTAARSSDFKKKLTRLGKLYAGSDTNDVLSSPIHTRTEIIDHDPIHGKPSSAARSARLARLARNIEEWEDDLRPSVGQNLPVTHKSKNGIGQPKNVIKSPVRATNSPLRAGAIIPHQFIVPTSPSQLKASPLKSIPTRTIESSPSKGHENLPHSPNSAHSPLGRVGVQMGASALQGLKSPLRGAITSKKVTKSVVWDQAILATLEAQGFKPSDSGNHLILDFEDHSQSQQEEEQAQEMVVEMPGINRPVHNKKEDSGLESSVNVSVSSPGWVYHAGSPGRPNDYRSSPKMGTNSPIAKILSNALLGSPVKSTLASPHKQSTPTKPPPDLQNISPGSVLQRAAMFESGAAAIEVSPIKDPAELTLAERKALFEKNKSGTPLLPKVAFSTPLPAKFINMNTAHSETSNSQAGKTAPHTSPTIKDKAPSMKIISESGSKVLACKAMFEKGDVEERKVVPTSQQERQRELDILRSRWDKQKKLSDDQDKPGKNTAHQERLEMQRLRDRWEKERRSSSESANSDKSLTGSPEPVKTSQPTISSAKDTTRVSLKKQYPVLATVGKIKVSPTKPGRLYPCLSDIDATESEMDTSGSTDHSRGNVSNPEDSNLSYTAEIPMVTALRQERVAVKRLSNEMSPSECAVLNEIDEFLDEALGSDYDSVEVGPTPPKKVCDKEFKTPIRQEILSTSRNTSVNISNAESSGSQVLIHTVSFYRRQQAQGARLATPVKQISRPPDSDSEDSSTPERDQKEVQWKIKSLIEEVTKQQTIISQTSQALNLCKSTVEFSNSSEQVEAERLLLVATQRRQAAIEEIERLKVEGTLNAYGNDTQTGSLSISNLTLPLRKDLLMQSRRNNDTEQFITCLIRCQEHVLATTMLPTSSLQQQDYSLHFPGTYTLQNLGSDFAIRLEVYALNIKRETISHEEKYHLKKDIASKLRLTPKKTKNESLLVKPVVQSPAGPMAVRSPSFTLVGYTVFSLREISRTCFTLSKVPYTSALEGHIGMKLTGELHLDVEQRGFLTMFEDISGFGAWHRRWCVLSGSQLSYWKYPDDEKRKCPIGSIDLKLCSNKQVGPVSREICARLNTFLIETRRPVQPDDKESLVMTPGKDFTTLRHLLSADTREDRVQWCNELNCVLASLRVWQANCVDNDSRS